MRRDAPILQTRAVLLDAILERILRGYSTFLKTCNVGRLVRVIRAFKYY
jgi:hypothetical protein